MKTLKSLVVVKSIAVAAFVAAGLAAPSISVASPQQGVTCPNTYGTRLVNLGGASGNSDVVMKCVKVVETQPEVRKSVCPVILFVNTTYVQRTNAADVCTRSDNGATVATVPEFVFDPQNWTRDVDGAAGALDRFTKGGGTHEEFVYPTQL